MDEQKYCVDCKYCRILEGINVREQYICHREYKSTPNVVNKDYSIVVVNNSCWNLRYEQEADYYACGEEGRHWEKRIYG